VSPGSHSTNVIARYPTNGTNRASNRSLPELRARPPRSAPHPPARSCHRETDLARMILQLLARCVSSTVSSFRRSTTGTNTAAGMGASEDKLAERAFLQHRPGVSQSSMALTRPRVGKSRLDARAPVVRARSTRPVAALRAVVVHGVGSASAAGATLDTPRCSPLDPTTRSHSRAADRSSFRRPRDRLAFRRRPSSR